MTPFLTRFICWAMDSMRHLAIQHAKMLLLFLMKGPGKGNHLPSLGFGEVMFPGGHDGAVRVERLGGAAFADAPKPVVERLENNTCRVGQVHRFEALGMAGNAITTTGFAVTRGAVTVIDFGSGLKMGWV